MNELDLSCSWLSGTIHSNSTLFLLPHLQSLNLALNNLSGSFVLDGFGRSSLTHLNLSDSLFSSLISPEISYLSNLALLDLSWNDGAEFSPHGFDSLVENLTWLQKLHLSGISISSVFPNSLLNRSSLISLDLSYSGFHGRFLDNYIHLPKLELLYLYGNEDLSGQEMSNIYTKEESTECLTVRHREDEFFCIFITHFLSNHLLFINNPAKPSLEKM